MDWWTFTFNQHLVIAVIVVASSPLSMTETCPRKCRCDGPKVTCIDTQMKYVPPGIPINTTNLEFRNNSLKVIKNQTQLHNLPRLRRLLLNENKITAIEAGSFWGHGNLDFLDLSFNDLRNLDRSTFRGLRGLTVLRLNNNLKLCLDFGSLGVLPELQKLVLGKTAVKFIPGLFETSPGNLTPPLGLLHLDLWNVGLEEVPYEAIRELTGLSILILSENKIKCLSHFAFAKNKNLTELDLSFNPIVAVESDTFTGLDRLVTLLLDNTNTLTTLPSGIFDPLPTTVKVCLYGNPWNCDCHLEWLKAWMEDQDRIHCAEKPSCHSPSDLRSNPFVSTPREEFRCQSSISKMPKIDCQHRIRYKEGYCLELSPSTTERVLTEYVTSAVTTTTTKRGDPPMTDGTNNLTILAVGICIILVLVTLVGGFLARQIRIQKKLHDQNKYFNISYENGQDQQLQMAESPTPEKEKSFN
ncbi:hypothetical protein BSL78_28829 [Apostichopus japonicus]|uniref:LRRCT domain-containing protein n=1 Tax=Stichopus japonicus TaxID=307972 RepID=A0A2G8JF24_STIJA|nr:hypothetical protein BSL78_28829 [Apostichopus japonicus]